jgi:hypothetical protein
MMKKHSIRVGNLEFRTCNELLLGKEPHTTGEIVRHVRNHTFTLAFWEKPKDWYFQLRFCLDRPFRYANPILFMWLAKKGQRILNSEEINETQP